MAVNWYVIHVYSGFEKRIVEFIKSRVVQKGLEEYVHQILVPTEDYIMIRKGAKVNSQRKFFPGYILVQMEWSDQLWDVIRKTPKTIDFLGAGGIPQPLSNEEAERILHQVQEATEQPKPAIMFEIGEQVCMCDGPFSTFNGFVEEVDHEKSRLKISVSIFGRATIVDLDYSQVEKIS